jgi:hypothetical protein
MSAETEQLKYALSIRDYVPQFLNLKEVDGKKFFLNALYTAIDEQSHGQLSTAEDASKQLFIATATGKYLINLGAQEGFVVPTNAGVDSESFRVIVPAVTSSPKQVLDTIVKIMGIFYDKTRINPFVMATKPSPYNLSSGDDIVIRTDSSDLRIAFLDTQVSDLSNVSAAELAGIINSTQTTVQADVFLARDTGEEFLRLVHSAYGTGAFLQIAGGTAQNVIQFPDVPGTTQTSSTTWDLIKEQPWTDLLKIRWNGVGLSPKLYHLEKGYFVSIRGLASPVDVLNGSFEVVEVGSDNVSGQDRDFFTIKNFRFQNVTGSFTQPANNSVWFTSSKKWRIFDAPEYAIISQTVNRSVGVYVPAVPQVLRNSLRSSAHAHGWQAMVLSFTRSSITVSRARLDTLPTAINSVILSSKNQSFDSVQKYYRTVAVSNVPNPVYTIDTINTTDYSVLPWTVPTVISTNPALGVRGEIFSNIATATFDYPHGLQTHWGFTLSSCAGAGNFTTGLLNAEQQVLNVIDDYSVAFRLNNGKTKFNGVSFNNFTMFQNNSFESGHDFYLDFATTGDLTASGLELGMSFTVDALASTISPNFSLLAEQLSRVKLQVKEVVGTIVYCYAGLGISLSINQILLAGVGKRSANVGGVSASYRTDLSTTYNQAQILKDMRASFIEQSASSNIKFVGGYVYDPDGLKSNLVLGTPVLNIQQQIIKGSNLSGVLVNTTAGMPSSGYVFFEYGTGRAEGPVRFFSTIAAQSGGDGQIILDPAYVFKFSHESGSQVQNVASLVKYAPKDDGFDYPVYITGTVQARDFFFTLIRQIVAAGVFISEDIAYPDVRYSDVAVRPYD